MPRKRISIRALRIASALGLPAPDHGAISRCAGRLAAHADRRARELARRLKRPGIILLSGPSGSGKSTLVRALHRLVPRAVTTRPLPRSRRLLAELIPSGGDAWLQTLSAAGIADGRLWLLPLFALSTGQRARLQVALAMWRILRAAQPSTPSPREGAGGGFAGVRPSASPAPSTPILLIDDLGCGLDAPTRASLTHALARWSRRAGITLLAATVHEDVEHWLRPDMVIRTSLASLTQEAAA